MKRSATARQCRSHFLKAIDSLLQFETQKIVGWIAGADKSCRKKRAPSPTALRGNHAEADGESCDLTMSKKELTRDIIISTLAESLVTLDYIHAFYEGGAAAFGRIDEWSDIDLYLIVNDDKVNEAFTAFEKALASMSSIRQKYEVTQSPWPGLSQAFYKLEDASEYLLIDLAVLKQNSQEKFLEPKIHGKAVLYFDKSGAAEIPKPDQDKFANKLQGRLNRLKARFEMFNIFVQKEINRGNYLEAIDLYFNLTLASLVEAIRMKHNPVHFDFKMRYIYREIPPGINERLEQLYSVDNREDLQTKYEQATKWFKRVISKMG